MSTLFTTSTHYNSYDDTKISIWDDKRDFEYYYSKPCNAAVNASENQVYNRIIASRLPEGTLLKDDTKGIWKLGTAIYGRRFRRGEKYRDFALVILANNGPTGDVTPDAEHVVKVEPFSKRMLTAEVTFYQNVAKPDLIRSWMTSRKIPSLGIPTYISTGSYSTNTSIHKMYWTVSHWRDDWDMHFKFIVMERLGTDLQKVFDENGKRFPRHTVLTIGLQLLEVLEYIHSNGYCHADIQPANMLLNADDSNSNQVFLTDYGMSYQYIVDGKLKPNRCFSVRRHSGTIEFGSRDAHAGRTPSRRGDLQSLAYCLLQWLCGKLPWERHARDPDLVQKEKNRYMANIPALMEDCFPDGEKPLELELYLQHIKSLQYEDKPDYELCKKILRGGLKQLGFDGDGGKLIFSPNKPNPNLKAPANRNVGRRAKRKHTESEDDERESNNREECTTTKGSEPANKKRPITTTGKEGNQSSIRQESNNKRTVKNKAVTTGKSIKNKKGKQK